MKKYLLILFLTLVSNETKAQIKENIIQKLEKILNIEEI